ADGGRGGGDDESVHPVLLVRRADQAQATHRHDGRPALPSAVLAERAAEPPVESSGPPRLTRPAALDPRSYVLTRPRSLHVYPGERRRNDRLLCFRRSDRARSGGPTWVIRSVSTAAHSSRLRAWLAELRSLGPRSRAGSRGRPH